MRFLQVFNANSLAYISILYLRCIIFHSIRYIDSTMLVLKFFDSYHSLKCLFQANCSNLNVRMLNPKSNRAALLFPRKLCRKKSIRFGRFKKQMIKASLSHSRHVVNSCNLMFCAIAYFTVCCKQPVLRTITNAICI